MTLVIVALRSSASLGLVPSVGRFFTVVHDSGGRRRYRWQHTWPYCFRACSAWRVCSFFHLPWEVPYGSFFVALDPLSAFFLLPIFILSGIAALYGSEYLQIYRERKSLGSSWFFFNLLVASMTLVVIARNGVLFLVAWEVMALASFFLVTFEDEHEQVREAGWVYLVATHLGTAFLLVLLFCSAMSMVRSISTSSPPPLARMCCFSLR